MSGCFDLVPLIGSAFLVSDAPAVPEYANPATAAPPTAAPLRTFPNGIFFNTLLHIPEPASVSSSLFKSAELSQPPPPNIGEAKPPPSFCLALKFDDDKPLAASC